MLVIKKSLRAFSVLLVLASADATGQRIAFEATGYGNATNCQRACSQLRALQTTSELTERYFAGQQRELIPTCVVNPESAAEVSQIVHVVKEQQCQFTVKSGGHGNHAGASSIQDGLVVDLSRLAGVTVTEDRSTALIGTGNKWIDVYTVLEEHGLSVVGGRASTVGVGGFTLGGGISFLSRRYGWALDTVRNFEVILANGTIANVNKESDPDLYFALRGGGNNFGIVTRFDFEARPLGLVSGGTTVFAMEDLQARKTRLGLKDKWEWTVHSILSQVNNFIFNTMSRFGLAVHSKDIFREFAALADEAQTDAAAHAYLFVSWSPVYYAMITGITSVYSEPEQAPAAFKNLTLLKKMHTTNRVANISDFVREVEAQNEYGWGKRQTWETTTFKVDADLISDLLDIFLVETHPIRAIPGVLASFNLQLITKSEIELFAKNGGNAFGVCPEDGPLFLFSLVFMHDNAIHDEVVETASHKILSKAIALGKDRGLHHSFIYQNYAGLGQDVYAGYGVENRARLVNIQRKYDPDGVFSTLQPGYFKL